LDFTQRAASKLQSIKDNNKEENFQKKDTVFTATVEVASLWGLT